MQNYKTFNLHDDFLDNAEYYANKGVFDYLENQLFQQFLLGGISAVVAAIYTKSENIKNAETLAKRKISLSKSSPNRFYPITSKTDMTLNNNSGKIGVVLSLEGLEPLNGEPSMLKEFYNLGVRAFSLTWKNANPFAFGVGDNYLSGEGGLTKKGFEVLEEANSLGLPVDISHLNDKGISEAVSYAKRIFASHSNLREIKNAPRNIPLEVAVKIADSGGIIGLNGYTPFLGEGDFLARFAENAKLLINEVGEDSAAIGLDLCDNLLPKTTDKQFDVIKDVTKINEIYDKMAEFGLSKRIIEKIAYQNAADFIEKTL